MSCYGPIPLPLQKSFHPTDRVDPAQPCLSTLFTQTHRPLLFLLPTPPPNRPSPSFLLTRQTNFAPFSAPCYKGNVQNIIETLMSFSANLYFPCNCTVEGVSVAERSTAEQLFSLFALLHKLCPQSIHTSLVTFLAGNVIVVRTFSPHRHVAQRPLCDIMCSPSLSRTAFVRPSPPLPFREGDRP